MTELTNISSLQEDLTAATNTINYAHEALKSAGIEADTLQDGVMQLVKRLEDMSHECGIMLGLLNDICRNYEECTHDDMMHALIPLEYVSAINSVVERDVNGENPCPLTDAFINARRAEGIHFAANRILAAWEAGFIDDTPARAYDISGAVLSALEFLPNASSGEFTRDYADEVRAAIANHLRTTGESK